MRLWQEHEQDNRRFIAKPSMNLHTAPTSNGRGGRFKPKGSSFNSGSVLNDRSTYDGTLKRTHTQNMHITSTRISSPMTRFYKGLYISGKCKPNCRVSSSGASNSIRRIIHTPSTSQHMKRKELSSVAQAGAAKRSRARLEVPDYHLTPSVRDEVTGSAIWPAPEAQMKQARDIILECASSQKRTIIVPDKDADGLSSGVILYRTLVLLGLKPELVHVHLLSKGQTVHHEHERQAMAALSPEYIFVLDQGSRKSGPLIDLPHKGLIIDHHHATPEDFPEGAAYCTANQSPPVVTSALLTYLLCEPLHTGVGDETDWLCVVGTHGDLGTALKWEAPFPDMSATLRKYTKKALNDVVSYVNAPRRTATYDVSSAFDALLSATHPKDVLKHSRLLAARQEVNAEVERCTHTAPKFSQDGKVAVFKIKSEAQVHPVIATRWAGHLQSKALEIVMVANEGYLPGKVNFSCRVPRCAKGRDPPVDIIQSLKAYASLKLVKDEDDDADGSLPSQPEIPLLERLGDDFARGHVQASGGIVDFDQFEELMRLMHVGEKKDKKLGTSPQKGKKPIDAGQSNKLTSYFGKKNA